MLGRDAEANKGRYVLSYLYCVYEYLPKMVDGVHRNTTSSLGTDTLKTTVLYTCIQDTKSYQIIIKCQFGHSELLIRTESSIKELKFDMRFKSVHNATVKFIRD